MANQTSARCPSPATDKMPDSSWRICCVVIFACAVDAADKALLPATFKAMEEELQVGPMELGALSFAQNIAFSLALPLWGSMMHSHSPRDLLASGCVLWASFTLMICWSWSYRLHFLLRLLIGASLAVVMPIGQAMICDLVPEDQRGQAFGLMTSVSALLNNLSSFVTTAVARQSVGGVRGWRIVYAVVAMLSFLCAMMVRAQVPATLSGSARTKSRSWLEEQVRVLRTVGRKPSFIFMVLQGVAGGIPWNAFAFLPFFYQLLGYSDVDAAKILLYGGLGSIMGGLLGGSLGDFFHGVWPYRGRCAVALTSVVLGSGMFAAVMILSRSSFWLAVILLFGFFAVGGWTPPAALRPMCGDLVRDSHARAQILALWIAFEGIISSFCGAPLAGALSEAFGYSFHDGGHNVAAMRSALLGVSLVPWTVCAFAWIPLFYTYPRDAGPLALRKSCDDGES